LSSYGKFVKVGSLASCVFGAIIELIVEKNGSIVILYFYFISFTEKLVHINVYNKRTMHC